MPHVVAWAVVPDGQNYPFEVDFRTLPQAPILGIGCASYLCSTGGSLSLELDHVFKGEMGINPCMWRTDNLGSHRGVQIRFSINSLKLEARTLNPNLSKFRYPGYEHRPSTIHSQPYLAAA